VRTFLTATLFRKLLCAFAVSLIAVVVVGVVGVTGLASVDKKSSAVADNTDGLVLAGKISRGAEEVDRLAFAGGLARAGSGQATGANAAYLRGKSDEHLGDFGKQIAQLDTAVGDAAKRKGWSAEEAKQVAAIRTQWLALKPSLVAAAALARENDAAKTATTLFSEGVDGRFDKMNAATDAFTQAMAKESAQSAKASTAIYHSKRILLILFILAGGAASIGAALVLSRHISARLRRTAALADAVAEGDLTGSVEDNGRDEVAQVAGALNRMVKGLADLTGKLQSGAESVAASASEILATVNNQTASANEQSAALNETTTATEEIRATAEQAAGKADEVANQAQSAVEVSGEGAQAVEAIVDGMGAIRDKVEGIAADVQALSEQTAQISAITSAVNDLADQSNLLALNATIEAARAGEQGKGFAVVADEVRNLAEQSKTATGQVQAILDEIEHATLAAVSAAQEGTDVVEHGTELAERAGQIISELAQANNLAAQSAQQIAATVQQQTTGLDQIAAGMHDTTQATNEFVTGMHQSQTAAEQLNQVASDLKTLASYYKL
jgi:methyl-accepting chemotaxis protein